MTLHTAIFDMDGLLIDSEPLWFAAAQEVMAPLGLSLDEASYATTVGLRTKEFLEHWFGIYGIDHSRIEITEEKITTSVIAKVEATGTLMPGARETIELLSDYGFRIGLATSSPPALIDAVLRKTALENYFQVLSSAADLPWGKPHPQVYLDCAAKLGSHPTQCLCFEDSFNGMIAAKAARMRCVVVPASVSYHHEGWAAADVKLPSLLDFNQSVLDALV